MLTTVVCKVLGSFLKKERKHGFTFMELVFVLCAVVALSAGAFVTANSVLQNGRYNAARSDVAAVSLAVSQYHFEVGSWPTTLDVLTTANGQYGPWLDAQGLTDPWGNSFNYTISSNNNSFAVWSNGQNRTNNSTSGSVTFPTEFLSDDIGLIGH